MANDLQLLAHYNQGGDALAFRELMLAHAGMVFATAQRVTRDAALAEDVTQETFIQLATHSSQISESVPAWLHRVAWRRACNAVRNEATRRKYENEASALLHPQGEAKWEELELVMDTVLDGLADHLRVPLVEHFLLGKSQRDIASTMGVNQSTISRAIEEGLSQVRAGLKSKGLLCGTGLATLLLEQQAVAMPTSLVASLGKVSGTGLGSAAVAASATGQALLSWSMKLKLGVAAVLAMTAGVAMLNDSEAAAGVAHFVQSRQRVPMVDHSEKNNMAGPGKAKSTVTSDSLDDGRPSSLMSISSLKGLLGTLTNHKTNSPSALNVTLPSRPAPLLAASPAKQSERNDAHTPTVAFPKLQKQASAAQALVQPGNRFAPRVKLTAMDAGNPLTTPVHELMHSFPTPPQRPRYHMDRDEDGWIWGTASGGDYGMGVIYKMQPDGSEWQSVVSLNGNDGLPRGAGAHGVRIAKDGTLWGTTAGGERSQGTVFKLDPRTGQFDTVAEFTSFGSPVGRPTITSDGMLWGITLYSVYRYDPWLRKLSMVVRFTGKQGDHPGAMGGGDLVEDGKGFLWGITTEGGNSNKGTIFKVHTHSGVATTVLEFSGLNGAYPGSNPWATLTLAKDGWLWGTTRNGGQSKGGTVFKVHPETAAFVQVAEFTPLKDSNPGKSPETQLVADEDGHLWATTSYGASGHGAVYKVNIRSGQLTGVVAFTGIEGVTPGGPARGDLLADGAGGFIGACDFGGKGWVGTIYHIEAKTGRYSLLKDMADLATSTEGGQPHGRLVAGSDGWLWGVTQLNGAHHSGTIYKINPVTNALTSVVDFTGEQSPSPGRFATAGLVSDGKGWLWGGNSSIIYKVHEASGRFVIVDKLGSSAELVADGKGFFWGASGSRLFKVNANTHQLRVITSTTSDRDPFPGSSGQLGALALDDRGFLWGCSQADRTHKRACLFKIDTQSDKLTVVKSFDDAQQGWSGWHPWADMMWDGHGSMWFTSVLDHGGARASCALYKLDTNTGSLIASYRDVAFPMLATPMLDEKGKFWGTTPKGGIRDNGTIFTFDTISQRFDRVMEFTGHGSQARSGHQPQVGRFIKHSDGNLYAVTRYGGPGNNGTVYRLRYGPTPMTQQATLLADGRLELHGTLTPNGLNSEASFEWAEVSSQTQVSLLDAGKVLATEGTRAVAACLREVKAGSTLQFRIRGVNAANRIPQYGAWLTFTMPGIADDSTLAANRNGSVVPLPSQAQNSSAKTKYELKLNLIPGAGAGFVKGLLTGRAYEIGQRYSLTAQADNGYIFHHWTGPGITGAKAESARLDFIFTKEVAASPNFTATFVENPFEGESIGLFNGLVLAEQGLAPSISNTGALRLTVTRTGRFTGSLCYDRQRLPVNGQFDTGGLARFGPARLSTMRIESKAEPTLLLALQLSLGNTLVHEVSGSIMELVPASPNEAVVRSVISSLHCPYDGESHPVPERYLTDGGNWLLSLQTTEEQTAEAKLRLRANGSAILAAKLSDGSGIIAQAPLDESQQASLFAPLYAGSRGSVGGSLPFETLLLESATEDSITRFWWGREDARWLTLDLIKLAPGKEMSGPTATTGP